MRSIMAKNKTFWYLLANIYVCFFFYTTTAFAVVTSSGSATVTPGTISNPTNIMPVYSLMGAYDGTNWQRISNFSGPGDALTTGNALSAIVFPYQMNGSGTYDRTRSGVNIGQALVDNSSNAVTEITTATDTAVKATAGYINEIIVNAGVASTTVTLYNVASAGCTGTPANKVAVLQTVTTGQVLAINHTFSNGICAVTSSTADISILYR